MHLGYSCMGATVNRVWPSIWGKKSVCMVAGPGELENCYEINGRCKRFDIHVMGNL